MKNRVLLGVAVFVMMIVIAASSYYAGLSEANAFIAEVEPQIERLAEESELLEEDYALFSAKLDAYHALMQELIEVCD